MDKIDSNILNWYLKIREKYNKRDIPEFIYKNEIEDINKKISHFSESLDFFNYFFKLLLSNLKIECTKFDDKIQQIDDIIKNNGTSNINQSIEELTCIYINITKLNETTNYLNNYIIKLYQITKNFKSELGLNRSGYKDSMSYLFNLNISNIPDTKESINYDINDINKTFKKINFYFIREKPKIM